LVLAVVFVTIFGPSSLSDISRPTELIMRLNSGSQS